MYPITGILILVAAGVVIAELARLIGTKIFGFSVNERPMIVTFIGDMNTLSAVLLVISLFPNLMNKIGMNFELYPLYSEKIIRALYSIILLIISYGYLRLKIWGYWLMVIINILSLALAIIMYQKCQHLYFANIIPALFNLIFILPTRKYFIKKG